MHKNLFVLLICLFSFLFSMKIYAQETEQSLQNDNTETENAPSENSNVEDTIKSTEETEENATQTAQSDTQDEDTLVETENPSIITIVHALKTSYVRDEEEDEESERIVFEGDVQVSVEKDNTLTTIFADLIEFNRTRNSLYAEGSVVMEQRRDGEVTERLTANSLLFDTNTLQGYFNEGRVVQEQQESLNLSDGSVLIVSSELFARGSSNTVTFKNGSLTFCNDENPHWEIKASRIWLLDGNEFAFANALLYVGPLPVMYFPFFYYPKDELVFNPAFGFRSREGFFIQTTTYILGRKPLSNDDDDESLSNSGFNFMQQTQLKEQELQGLVLRNLEDNATMPPNHLKVMADYYSTLGGMVGVEGYFEVNNIIKSIDFNSRLGFSNVVFQIDDFPLYVSYDNDLKYQDHGWFFGTKLPFRYAGNFSTSLQAGAFNVSLDFPFYSDPWFDSDFNDRNESMDWIDFFLSGALVAPPDEDDDDADEITGYTWDVFASYNVPIEPFSPWISKLSIDTLASSVTFATQNTPLTEFDSNVKVQANSPNREFFYASQIQPVNLHINMAGTLYEWSSEGNYETDETLFTLTEEQTEVLTLLEIPELIIENETTEENENTLEDTQEDSTVALIDIPDITFDNQSINTIETSEYAVRYTLEPEYSMLYTYSPTQPYSSLPIEPSSINIADPQAAQIYFKSPLSITGTYSSSQDFLSFSNSILLLPELQKHIHLSDEYFTEEEKENIYLSDHKAKKFDVRNTNSVSINPFTKYEMFKNSRISWNTSINIIKTEFEGDAKNPEWSYNTPSWDEDSIYVHNLNAVFEARQDAYYQSITLATNLPPLVDQYTGTLLFGFPLGKVEFEAGYKQESSTSDTWIAQPFEQTSSWTFFDKTKDDEDNVHKINLSQSFKYNIEDEHIDSFSTSLSWQDLQFSYDMRYTNSYTLDSTLGWISSSEKTFQPYALTLLWNVNDLTIRNQTSSVLIKPGLSTSLSWDMIIPTRSYFSFRPALSVEISRFLTITFAAESRNDQLVRYVQNAIGFSQVIPGEQNIFIDLFNSFAFFDEAKRSSSGFKIESFNLYIEHDLHDWTLTSELEIEPRIITESSGLKRYDYSPFFTLSVLWKPMSGIKTTIEDEYGEFLLNP